MKTDHYGSRYIDSVKKMNLKSNHNYFRSMFVLTKQTHPNTFFFHFTGDQEITKLESVGHRFKKKIEKVIATFTIFYPKNNFHFFQTQCFIDMNENYNVPELIPILGEEVAHVSFRFVSIYVSVNIAHVRFIFMFLSIL